MRRRAPMKRTRMKRTAEEWRPIAGYEGMYEVSDHGRVRSLDNVIINKAGAKRRWKGRVLSPAPNPVGYLRVNLRGRTNYVHRLVLHAFVGPAPEGYECCHNDGDPANNHLSNLRWATSSENTYDLVRLGTHNEARKTHCPRGHALVEPNLVASEMKHGRRSCLACSRAHDQVRHRPHMKPDLQRIADEFHDEIISVDGGKTLTAGGDVS